MKRLANEEAIQSRFMRFRTRHVQNMQLDELFTFLGRNPAETYHYEANASQNPMFKESQMRLLRHGTRLDCIVCFLYVT